MTQSPWHKAGWSSTRRSRRCAGTIHTKSRDRAVTCARTSIVTNSCYRRTRLSRTSVTTTVTLYLVTTDQHLATLQTTTPILEATTARITRQIARTVARTPCMVVHTHTVARTPLMVVHTHTVAHKVACAARIDSLINRA